MGEAKPEFGSPPEARRDTDSALVLLVLPRTHGPAQKGNFELGLVTVIYGQ
jgi:hypothetical protein